MSQSIETPEAMEEFGRGLGLHFAPGSILYLRGDLGAGKTTLVRGFLRAHGYTGKVKSPTYTLVESYHSGGVELYHFDLYRLERPEELNTIGFRDYFEREAIILLEWPEKAMHLLPAPDLQITFHIDGQTRSLDFHPAAPGIEGLLPKIQ